MVLYNINLIFIFICLSISRYELIVNKNKINSYILNVISFFSLWIVPATRYHTVGTDTEMYRNIFLRIDSYNIENSPVELGYIMLNKIIDRLNIIQSTQTIFWITSFIILYLVSRVIFKYSKAYELSFFLFITMYFYYNSFNLTRQFIAIAISFYAVKYMFSKNFKKYIFCIFIACSFHQSSIIMLPFYYILQIKFTQKIYSSILAIGVVGYFVIDKVLGIIFSIMPRYVKYSDGELSKLLTDGSHWIHALTLLVLIIVALIFREKLIKQNIDNNIYINAVLFATVFQILGVKSVLFSRVVYYLSIYAILLIPNILDLMHIKKRSILYLTIIVIYGLNNIVLLMLNQSQVLPYINV